MTRIVNFQSNIVIDGNGINIMNCHSRVDSGALRMLMQLRECLQIVPRGTITHFLRDFFVQYLIEVDEVPADYEEKARAVIELFEALGG